MEGGRVIYASISKAKPSSFSAASVIHVSIRPEAPIKMLSMISGLNLKVLIPAGRLAIDAFYSPLKKLLGIIVPERGPPAHRLYSTSAVLLAGTRNRSIIPDLPSPRGFPRNLGLAKKAKCFPPSLKPVSSYSQS